MSAHENTLCAVDAAGTVRCWLRTQLWHSPAEFLRGRTIGALSRPGTVEVVAGPGWRVCARTRQGGFACVFIDEEHVDNGLFVPVEIPLRVTGEVFAVRRMALGAQDLCVLGTQGEVACVVGPDRSTPSALRGQSLVLTRVPSLEGASEIALAQGIGCARWPHGAVRCWGPFARAGSVQRVQRPTEIEGIDAAEQLIGGSNTVCARQRGRLLCLGDLRDAMREEDTREYAARAQDGAARVIDLGAPIAHAVFPFGNTYRGQSLGGLCGITTSGEARCGGFGQVTPARDRVVFRGVFAADEELCGYDDRGRAWCSSLSTTHWLTRTPARDGVEAVRELGFGYWVGTCQQRRGRMQCTVPATAEHPGARLRDVIGVIDHVCTMSPRGEVYCVIREPWAPVTPLTPEMLATLGGQLRAADGGSTDYCLLGTNGRIACETPRGLEPVEGLDDAQEIAYARGMWCARRANGRVVCWGNNLGNALTAREVRCAPSLVIPPPDSPWETPGPRETLRTSGTAPGSRPASPPRWPSTR